MGDRCLFWRAPCGSKTLVNTTTMGIDLYLPDQAMTAAC